jgi:hypothetical protein
MKRITVNALALVIIGAGSLFLRIPSASAAGIGDCPDPETEWCHIAGPPEDPDRGCCVQRGSCCSYIPPDGCIELMR